MAGTSRARKGLCPLRWKRHYRPPSMAGALCARFVPALTPSSMSGMPRVWLVLLGYAQHWHCRSFAIESHLYRVGSAVWLLLIPMGIAVCARFVSALPLCVQWGVGYRGGWYLFDICKHFWQLFLFKIYVILFSFLISGGFFKIWECVCFFRDVGFKRYFWN